MTRDLLPFRNRPRTGPLPHFPLASGLLTGRYRRGEPAPAGTRPAVWNVVSVLTDQTFDVP